MKRLLGILITVITWWTPTISQHNHPFSEEGILSPDLASVFGPETALTLEIVLDMKSLFRKKQNEKYETAVFSIVTEAGGKLTREIGIKTRGQYRRSFCAVPPLKLKFKGADFGYEEWDKLKSLKLVTTCKNSPSFRQYLVKEYLAYQLYHALTPQSFRVRMASITFIDSEGKYSPIHQLGFFIEDIDDVAERNQAFELEPEVMSESWADPASTTFMNVFQYAIGNTDWHVGNLHNMKVIRSDDPVSGKTHLIPYDFDFSGFVHTHYALPNESLMIPDVQTRLYLGRCHSEYNMREALVSVYRVQETWNQLIRRCEWLEPDMKEECLQYLGSFFNILEDPRQTDVIFFQNCATMAER